MTPLVALPAPITGDHMNEPGYTAHISPAGDITYTYDPNKSIPGGGVFVNASGGLVT